MQLRQYQSNIIAKTYDAIRSGARHVLICLPTGGGKTAISSEIVRRCFEKGNRSIFCVHRQELMAQTFQTYVKNGLTPSLIKSGAREHTDNPCQIAMITTLVNRLDRYPNADVLIMDECFEGNMRVLTSEGYVKIKNLHKGTLVKTFNETNKIFEYKPIQKVIEKPILQNIVKVKIGNKTIICTENHKFYTKKGWKKAKDLCNNDYVMLDNTETEIFNWVRVESVKIQKRGSSKRIRELFRENKVYDLSVEDNHNYFVEGVLVHNCHHQASNTWAKVADFYKNAVIIGLSATPCRLDGKPLNKFFDVMVEETTTKQLIKDGYLVPYQYFAPSEIDESGLVLGSNGEYTRESVEAVIKTSAVIGNNIKTYKELCYGKRNVVFAVNRKHAEAVCAEYNKAGIPAEMLDGTCSDRERKETLARFGKNETKVLVNVDLFGEGFDLPAIEVVSLLRPTHSTALYLQQVGRALRTCPEIGKTQAIILDHVNNYKRHGFPDDERQWSLDGKIRTTKSEESLVRIKRCPVCFFAHPPALVCPNCGYEYQSDGRTIEEINGKLVMIGSSEYKDERKIEVIKAKSLTELVQIEKDRGYKKYWAEKQWQLKTGENLWSSVNGLKKIEDARGYRKGWCWVHKARRK